MDLLREKLRCSPMGARLYCGGGGGGGDGGAAERKAAEDRRQKEAINRLNSVFGIAGDAPVAEDYAGTGGGSALRRVVNKVRGPQELARAQEGFAEGQSDIEQARQQREALYGT